MTGVAGLVLAAGGGARLGGPKALLRLDGETLAERAVRVLHDGGCEPVTLVTGAAHVWAEGAMVVSNPLWETGMGSSLKAGLEALSDVDGLTAAIVILVDMPGIGFEAVHRMTQYARPEVLAMATYGGKRGHPVLLGREHWAGVIAMAHGDVGARPYLATQTVVEVPCDDVSSSDDVDTRDDAHRWGMNV